MKKAIEPNIEMVQTILFQGIEKIQSATGLANVLVIGPTGSGKSTFIKKMLGERLVLTKTSEGNIVIDVERPKDPKQEGQRSPTIGHCGSQTLHAETFSGGDVNWIDTAGVFGLRPHIEERVVESVALELAIRASKKIEGIVVFIKYTDITSSRPEAMIALCKMLADLFANPSKTLSSVLWVIGGRPITRDGKTESDEVLLSDVKIGLNSTIALCNRIKNQMGAEANTQGFTKDDYELAILVANIILSNFDNNVVIPNVLDQGESRTLIKNKLQGSQLKLNITQSQVDDFFHFDQYDKFRKMYNDAVIDVASQCLIQISEAQNTVEKIRKNSDLVNSTENKIRALKDQKSKAMLPSNLHELKAQQIEKCRTAINTNKELIKTKQNTKNEKIRDISSNESSRKIFDSAEAVSHWQYDDTKFKVKSSWFSRIIQAIEYPYSEKIKEISKVTSDKGEFKEETGGVGSSSWKAKFVSNLTGKTFGSGAVRVDIKIEKRHKSDSIAMIAYFDVAIKKFRDEIQVLDGEISHLTQENVRHEGLIATLQSSLSDLTEERSRIIAYIDQQINIDQSTLDKANNEILGLKKLLGSIAMHFSNHARKYDLTLEIVRLLPFESSAAITRFKHEYSSFTLNKDKIFSGDVTALPKGQANVQTSSVKMPFFDKRDSSNQPQVEQELKEITKKLDDIEVEKQKLQTQKRMLESRLHELKEKVSAAPSGTL